MAGIHDSKIEIFEDWPDDPSERLEARLVAQEKATRSTLRRFQYPRLALLSAVLAGMIGAACGIGAFTFGYGQGWSYLSNNPTTCANCHVMQGHFDTWQNSSHRHVAVCNDCHLPHHAVGKWMTKADNGFFHSLAFTLENFHEPIQIKPRNRRVAQHACMYCHAEIAHQMLPVEAEGEMLSCVHCHSDVGHAHRRRSGTQ